MNTNPQRQGSELESLYEASVQHERDAWTLLQSHPPGSIGRARAWEDWSRAIMLTNQAWRRVSAQRVARPAGAASAAAQGHARS
jgi:hypothetical protein